LSTRSRAQCSEIVKNCRGLVTLPVTLSSRVPHGRQELSARSATGLLVSGRSFHTRQGIFRSQPNADVHGANRCLSPSGTLLESKDFSITNCPSLDQGAPVADIGGFNRARGLPDTDVYYLACLNASRMAAARLIAVTGAGSTIDAWSAEPKPPRVCSQGVTSMPSSRRPLLSRAHGGIVPAPSRRIGAFPQ
jgi:hypothetical protein